MFEIAQLPCEYFIFIFFLIKDFRTIDGHAGKHKAHAAAESLELVADIDATLPLDTTQTQLDDEGEAVF